LALEISGKVDHHYRSDVRKKKRRFKKLIEPQAEKLYLAAYRLTGSRADAEDLAQESLLKAYRNLDHLTDETNPGGWVYTILKNSFLNALKKRKRTPQALHDPAQIDQLPANDRTDEDDSALDDRLQGALMALPEEMRLMLVAREIEGFSYEEIAALHALPPGTVKSRINRARQQLRRLYLQNTD